MELCDCSSVIQVKVVPPLPGSLKAARSMWLEIPGRNIRDANSGRWHLAHSLKGVLWAHFP